MGEGAAPARRDRWVDRVHASSEAGLTLSAEREKGSSPCPPPPARTSRGRSSSPDAVDLQTDFVDVVGSWRRARSSATIALTERSRTTRARRHPAMCPHAWGSDAERLRFSRKPEVSAITSAFTRKQK
jgi:hypothetical protein